MTYREFIATAEEDKVGTMMCDLIAHGQLCKKFCVGCKKAKFSCKEAVAKMLKAEVDVCYEHR